jgi:hypothetical protein
MVGTEDPRMESAEDFSRLNVKFIEDDVMSDVIDDDETYKKDRLIYADEIPVEDECLEIQDSPEEICLTFKVEPMDGLISPIPSFNEHLKSPFNSISDCGYESVGSPASIKDFSITEQQDDLNYLLNDLFPSLA